MQVIRLKGIKRIIIPASLQAAGGTGEAIKIKGKRRSKRKKQSKGFKFFEKLTRRGMKSGGGVYDQYLKRHKRSNRKKKNGWIKDLNKNAFNSLRKGRKKFKLSTLF
jgi:Family of unknown function (DUF6312)